MKCTKLEVHYAGSKRSTTFEVGVDAISIKGINTMGNTRFIVESTNGRIKHFTNLGFEAIYEEDSEGTLVSELL